MLIQLLLMVVKTAAGLLSFVLLARLLMLWTRTSLRNPLGRFLLALTDWAVLPARRIIPAGGGFDLASLALAWIVQALYLGIAMLITQQMATGSSLIGLLTLAATLETLKIACYLVEVVVILGAVLSWVNPQAPLAPLLFSVTQPLLRPFQRFIPLIGGVDLSPIALLLLLQLILGLIESLRFRLPMMLT